MNNYLIAISYVIKNEGMNYFEDSTTGEKSKFGITEKFLKSIDYYDQNPQNLNGDEAINIYWFYFWKMQHLNELTNIKVATKILDMMVNMGVHQATQLVQRTLEIKDDGVFGFLTISAVNKADSDDLLNKLVVSCKDFYTKIAIGNNTKFLEGWLNRAGKIPV